jgi:hypothetical protein
MCETADARGRDPGFQRVGPLGGVVVRDGWVVEPPAFVSRFHVHAGAPLRFSLVALTLTVVAPAFVIALVDCKRGMVRYLLQRFL